MNKKILAIFTALILLILPAVSASVLIQLGNPYVNIDDVSKVEFSAHSDYYELCSLDKVVIPVLIKNDNLYPDTFSFSVDKEYASLPVKSAMIGSGKSAVLPLALQLPSGMKENTTLALGIVTKKEGLKRSVLIKTNVGECYLFDLKFDKPKDELCSCDNGKYTLTLQNRGLSTDSFTIDIDAPEWVNLTLTDGAIQIPDGQKKEIIIEANPSCDASGNFDVSIKASSGNSKTSKQAGLKLDVIPNDKCYSAAIGANDARIDYMGKNIPVTIKNNGARDASYSLSIGGVSWYKLSQTEVEISAGMEKKVNLALYPDKGVVEGEYNLDIRAESNGKETISSIKVDLTSKSSSFDRIKFYLNYFRYYIWLAVVMLLIIIGLVVLFRVRKKRPVAKKKEIKVVKRENKIRVFSSLKSTVKRIRWMPWIYGLLMAVLLAGIIYSYFKYKLYYISFFTKCLQIFKSYAAPYLIYWKYAVIALLVILVLAAIIYFVVRWTKRKKKARAKKDIKIIDKKEPAGAVEKKKIAEEKVKGKGFNVFGYVHILLAVSLFLGIIGYAAYKLFGKPIDLARVSIVFNITISFVKKYYLFFILGIAAILVIFLAIFLFNKFKKSKAKKKPNEKKAATKPKSKSWFKAIRSILFVTVGLSFLGGLAYYLIHYNPIIYAQEFFILYYPYILMGIGILLILIVILHFHGKKQ